MTPKVIVLGALLLGTGAVRVAAQVKQANEPEPITFNTLLIVKRTTDIHQAPFLRVRARLTDEDIRAVTAAFEEHTPYWVEKLSHGRVRWNSRVVVSEVPLRSVNGDRMCAACGAANYVDDVRRFVKQGEVDGVFVYFKHIDDQTGYRLPRAFGLSIGPDSSSCWAGQTCVNWAPPDRWARESETTEIFLHEWLHQVEAFYGSKGVRLPKGGLHGGEEHGYRHEGLGAAWKRWYEDFLNGAVKEDPELVGLGERAWKLGTIRESARSKPVVQFSSQQHGGTKDSMRERALLPSFLTARRRERTLLSNGSFESGLEGWEAISWRKRAPTANHDLKVMRAGQGSVQLRCTQGDTAHLTQRVTVKPYCNYLFSGWIKTEGVTITEAGGQLGANLWVKTTGEHSAAKIVGDSDWQYVYVMFYSQDKTDIAVAARLGGDGSTLEGTAWFDDLCVVELDAQ